MAPRHHQQSRDVAAGDEQHETEESHEQAGQDVRVAGRAPHAQLARRKHSRRIFHSAIVERECLLELLAKSGQLRARLLDSHAGAEPRDDDESVVVGALRQLRRPKDIQRHVELRGFDRCDRPVAGWENTEKRVGLSVECQRLTDAVRIGLQHAAPERMTRNDQARVPLRRRLRVREHTSELGLDSQAVEEVSCHRQPRHGLVRIAGAKADLGAAIAHDRFEHRALFEVAIVQIGELIAVAWFDAHDLERAGHRRLTEEHRAQP